LHVPIFNVYIRNMIERPLLTSRIRKALGRSRVVVLAGPRQCGKTTLARAFLDPAAPGYFDLEDARSLARLAEPFTALENLKGLVVIDEIQRAPKLFETLRVLADRKPLPAKFLILGSASPDLLRQTSETLAGRVEIVEMGGFVISEIGAARIKRHWLRGGFPHSFLAASNENSFEWRKSFIQTVLERDLPQLGVHITSFALSRFWMMAAHRHGGIWNAAEPARSLGLSEKTIRHYLDLLTGIYMVRQLKPWHANISKRQVKAPKIYIRDTGLLHQLLGIRTETDLLGHPLSGASWEGRVIEEIIRAVSPDEACFWATHSGAEIDLVLVKSGRLYGVECKRSDAPAMTRSMQIALEDLKLERIAVIYPGDRPYRLAKKIAVVPFKEIEKGFAGIFQE
jgi:uncharacterized protein